jgi:hypothetical protein
MSEPVGPVDPWDEYRRRRKLNLFAFIGYLPVVFGTAVIAEPLIHFPGAPIVVMVGWMIFIAVADVRHAKFRCPRCGGLFFLRYGFYARYYDEPRCVHCGLPKYAPPVPDEMLPSYGFPIGPEKREFP